MKGRLAAGILHILEEPSGLFDFATDSLTCDPQDIKKSFYDMFMVPEGFKCPSVQFQAAISWCDMYLFENNRQPHYLKLAPSEFIVTAGIIIITSIIIKALDSFHLPSLFSAITALCWGWERGFSSFNSD